MPLKRFIAILMISSLTVLLCACGSASESDTIDVSRSVQTPFEASATITLAGMESAAVITRPSMADCSIRFTAPESLAGMVMELKNEELTVSVNSMGFTLLAQNLPASMAPKIVSALLSSGGAEAKKVDSNQAELSGMSELGGYIIRIDRDTGAIVSLSAPESGFEAKLSDFVFTD